MEMVEKGAQVFAGAVEDDVKVVDRDAERGGDFPGRKIAGRRKDDSAALAFGQVLEGAKEILFELRGALLRIDRRGGVFPAHDRQK